MRLLGDQPATEHAATGAVEAAQSARDPRRGGSPYRIKNVRLGSGEILPFLLDAHTGMPPHLPNLFVILTKRKWAEATIERHLRSLIHLLVFAELRGIDLEDRVRNGSFLSSSELDSLAAACARPLKHILYKASRRREAPRGATSAPRHAVPALRVVEEEDSWVAPETAAIRLLHIRDYLVWWAKRTNLHALGSSAERMSYVDARNTLSEELLERVAQRKPRSSYVREPISHEQEQELLEVIDPSSVRNPWKGSAVRERNQLLVLWYLLTGMRRDEGLAVRVDQINWFSNLVKLERKVITQDDPRRTPARVKTAGRPIPIDELAEVAERFVAEARQTLPKATKHPFLFVEVQGGKPMTRSAVASVFRRLNNVLRWPRPVTPHVLRHTWNDRFSERAEELGWSAEQEAEYRCLLMGWKNGSSMAMRYTRKRQERKAIEASRALQERMFPRKHTP